MLVVDLDHSLLRTDLLFESFLDALSRQPRAALAALGALGHGRAALKARLVALSDLDIAALPVNEEVLRLVEAERRRGGRTALVSASDQRLVDRVAARFGVFDEAWGSDGTRNLKGAEKARFLVERYGAGGFDYVADHPADLAVWQNARRALTVAARPWLRSRVERIAPQAVHLAQPASAADYLLALRPHQWLKNLLVFLPALAAHRLGWPVLGPSLLAFVTFCLVASSVYVANDLLDLKGDRAHLRKRHRPFASGRIPIAHGAAMAAALVAVAALLCLAAGAFALLGVLAIYLVTNMAYSLHLKRLIAIDICLLAGFYTLRIVAGSAAAGLFLSPWMLAFSCFFFFALGAVKRQTELVAAAAAGRSGPVPGRGWQVEDAPVVTMMAVASGYLSVLVFALYCNTAVVKRLYESPFLLWLIAPVLMYWLSRTVMLAHRGELHDDPLVFAVRDPVSLGSAALIAALGLLGTV